MGNNEDNNQSDTFCVMPWVHLHIAQNGNVIPCCQAPPQKVHRFGNINESSISSIWKGKEMDQFRNTLLAGKKDIRCKQCYIKEEKGWQSLRQTTNQKYRDIIRKVQKNQDYLDFPIYFDIRFSNACNLKCRICGPWASSQWFKDAKKLGMRQEGESPLTVAVRNEKQFFEELVPLLKEAKEFYFAGGEPLMMEQHYYVLQSLIDLGNTDIQLAYNTNFSTFSFKDKKVIEYWKKFKRIRLAASLDATGKRGELLRKNLNWEQVEINRKILLENLPHIVFQLAPTVCYFNIEHIPVFHQEWVEKGWVNVEDFIPNILIHPKEYHFNLLSIEKQLQIKQRYIKHLSWMQEQQAKNQEQFQSTFKQFESITQELGRVQKVELLPILKDKIDRLDELRNENTLTVFPELQH